MELSFKARADILGAPDYGLEGNRSESLRLIESYTEFQKVLARIGLQTAGETRVSTEVPLSTGNRSGAALQRDVF